MPIIFFTTNDILDEVYKLNHKHTNIYNFMGDYFDRDHL